MGPTDHSAAQGHRFGRIRSRRDDVFGRHEVLPSRSAALIADGFTVRLQYLYLTEFRKNGKKSEIPTVGCYEIIVSPT
jgi:hypothetical protein